MTTYVLSYLNPSTDIVMSMIWYSFLMKYSENTFYKPIIFGKINSETELILNSFDIVYPLIIENLDEIRLNQNCNITIIWTWNQKELPKDFPFDKVNKIITNEKKIDKKIFPNAEFITQNSSSLASIITDKIFNTDIKLSKRISGLLSYAIISITNNLKEDKTTEYDKEKFKWLSKYIRVNPNFIEQMLEKKWSMSFIISENEILSNLQKLNFKEHTFAISCLKKEINKDLINEKNINKTIDRICKNNKFDYMILKIDDKETGDSIIFAKNESTKNLINQLLWKRFDWTTMEFNKNVDIEMIIRKLNIFFNQK